MSQQQKKEKIKKYLQFSKKLAYFDIIIYSIIMAALIALIILRPDLAEYCVSIAGYSTTAYVALRGAYSAKSTIENIKKIQNNPIPTYDDENDGNG